VNYDYWETRAQAEQREDMLEARSLTFQADQFINEARVLDAIKAYEKAWTLWHKIFSRYPSMITEEVGDDLVKSLGRYKKLNEEELDDKFILHEFLEFRKAKDEGTDGLGIFQKTEELNTRAKALLEAESRGEIISAPEPTVPVAETPDKPVEPAAVEPINTKAEEMKPEPAKPESAEPEPAKPEPAKPEPAQTETAQTETAKPQEPSAEANAEVNAEFKKEEMPSRPPTLENPDSQN